MGHHHFDSSSEIVASASTSSSRLLHDGNSNDEDDDRMPRQCQHIKTTPATSAAAAALAQEERTAQTTTAPPSSEEDEASVAGTRDMTDEAGGGVAQLEAELREAKARASNAEDLSRERGEACDRLRQEIARLERRASDGFGTGSTGTASPPPPPAIAARMEAEGMMAPTARAIQHHDTDDSIAVSTTTTTATTTNARTSTLARPRPSSAAAAAAEAAAVAAAVAAASARAEIPDMKEARPLPPGLMVETGAANGRHANEQRRAAAASAAGAAAAAAATVGRRGGSGAPDMPPYRGPLSAAPLMPTSSSPPGLTADAGGRGGGGRFMPGSAPAPGVATSFGGPAKEDTRQRRAKSMSPRQAQERAYLPYDGVRCIEIPVGREDEGLLLGGGRVLHKLKEELGGTLEYRRSQGVVCVYGQQGGPRKAAACVRTALLLRDGRGEPRAEKYDLARLCMDDLLAECIALKGLKQAGTASPGTSSTSSATTCPASYSDGGGSESSSSPGTDPWSPIQAAAAAVRTPSVTSSVSSSSSSFAPPPDNSGVAAAIAAAAAVTVASNLPDGEYPPETSSLRIIGEKFGCVIDVVGEAAAAAAAAAVNASVAACEGGRGGGADADVISLLQAVGSATPVGHQDILIWGPAGVVGEAKDAVCSLVSGSASAEVMVGVGRIGRRDRGFWVNCETMAGGEGASLEVDHKRGVVVVRGLPQEVEEGRKEFQDKLASLFPGDFLAVPMPRAALKDLADAQGLAGAAAQAGVVHGRDERPDGCDEAGGVELWADWPFSCVRLRGEPATVRRAAKALYAALALWNTLEVSVTVDRAIVTRLLSRSGRILAGISSNMGITLLVEREKGVLRGRARTEDEAKEANRVLKLKVAALAQRRSEQINAANSAAAAAAAAAPKAPVLSPGLSSTHSERSCVSVEHGPRLELTDAFEELQAFFGGGPPDEGVPSAPTKRSCVFDGVEDVPSSTGFPAGSSTKGLGTRRKAGPSRPGVPEPASVSGRGRGGVGVGSARAAAAGLAAVRPNVRGGGGHDHHHHHLQRVADVNRRGVMIHRPVLSPSSSVGSPPFSPPAAGAGPPDAGGYHHHRARVRDMHQRQKQHAFRGGAIAVSPSPSPSPTRLMNLPAHHYYAQETQYHHHHGSPDEWAVPREEHHHLRCHQQQQHVASHRHHQQQQQQRQHQLLSMERRSGGGGMISQATREADVWVDGAEEFGLAPSSDYEQRRSSRPQQYLAAEDDYLYHRSGEGFRVGSAPPAGYCSTTTMPAAAASHAVGNELRGEFLSQGFTAAHGGGGGNEADYYDGDAPPPPARQQQLGRWKSDDPGCYRSTVASSYPASAAAAFGRGGSNVRGW